MMQENNKTWLVGRAAGIMIVAIVAGLVAAQWKHEAIPLVALAVILVLSIVKSRWVILDFMGLRGIRPRLAFALLVWPAFFAVAAAARAALASYGLTG